MPDIQVDVSYAGDNDEIAIISAKGFIDTTTAPELEKKLEEQLALNKYKIIVDLENIDYVSSAGWGVFVSEIREIRENNGDLILVNMSPDVYDVYELMEFSSILKSFDSLDDAIAYFTGKKPVEKSASVNMIGGGSESGGGSGYQAGAGVSSSSGGEKLRKSSKSPAENAKEESEKSHKTGGFDIFSYAKSELGRRIINVILDNPYFEVKEIAKALKLPQYGGKKAGVGAVKRELKAMGLFDRQKRFEIALKGRG